MIFPAGTINQHINKMSLEKQWGGKKNITDKDRLDHWLAELNDPARKAREQTSGIAARMQTGKKLSPSELEHLRLHAPELYSQARRIIEERAAYEKKLRNARSKEEVRAIHAGSIVTVASGALGPANETAASGGEDMGLARVSALSEAHRDFTGTRPYAVLPETRRESEKRANRIRPFVRRG